MAPNTTLPAFALPAVPFAVAPAAEGLAWESVICMQTHMRSLHFFSAEPTLLVARGRAQDTVR